LVVDLNLNRSCEVGQDFNLANQVPFNNSHEGLDDPSILWPKEDSSSSFVNLHLVQSSLASEQPNRLFPIFVREGRSRTKYKAGYINSQGEIVVPPVYQHAHPFYNGLASVMLQDRWGVIDVSGEMVIPPKFGGALEFVEGLSRFGTGHKSGAIDKKGNVVIPPRWGTMSYFSGGLACVRDRDVSQSNALYGFIDKFGNQVIPPFFEDARGFSEGLAAVKMNGKWGYINPNGSTAIPMEFVCERGMAGPFRQDRARVAKDDKWGHINKEGQFVTEPRFDMAYEFSEGLARIEMNKRQGYVDLIGNLVISPIFRDVDSFSCDLGKVNTGTGEAHKSIADACETGFINKKGEFEISPRFFAAGKFQQGFCLVETEKKIGYINRFGEFIWSSGWVELGSLDPHHLLPPEEVTTSDLDKS